MDTRTRVIKRYSNRKLYDVTNSRYVTLEEVYNASLTERVNVADKGTGEDLTAQTLLLALTEQEKRSHALSLDDIVQLIKRRESLKAQKPVTAAPAPAVGTATGRF